VASAAPYASLHLARDRQPKINHASTPPLKFFTGQLLFLPPNLQRECTEDTSERTRFTFYFAFSLLLVAGSMQ